MSSFLKASRSFQLIQQSCEISIFLIKKGDREYLASEKVTFGKLYTCYGGCHTLAAMVDEASHIILTGDQFMEMFSKFFFSLQGYSCHFS